MLSLTELAVTIAEADAYAHDRNHSAWFGGTVDKDAALRRGQDFVAGRFNGRWKADFANNAAPDAVKFAIIEAALREAVAPGSLLPDWMPSGMVKSERKKVGPLEKQTEFVAPATAYGAAPAFGMIDALLSGLVRGAGASNFAVSRG